MNVPQHHLEDGNAAKVTVRAQRSVLTLSAVGFGVDDTHTKNVDPYQ